MQSRGIRASIAGIIIILLGILAGILYYARDSWQREAFRYPWQLSHTIREGIAERTGKNPDIFTEKADALIKNFQENNPLSTRGANVPDDSLYALISGYTQLSREYFYNRDSLKRFVRETGLDTAFNLRMELVRLQFMDPRFHPFQPEEQRRAVRPPDNPARERRGEGTPPATLPEERRSAVISLPVPADERFKAVSIQLDSLLRSNKMLRMVNPAADTAFTELMARGIRSRGNYFLAEYRVFIFPRHLKQTVLSRLIPLYMFLTIAFIVVLVFSVFTIKTLLKQKWLSDLKTDFINNITHEFNTPLATIAVASKILQGQAAHPDPEKIRSVSAMIDRQNAILQQMVSTITESANDNTVRTGELPPIHPKPILEKILQDFRVLHRELGLTLETTLDITETITIRADPAVFTHILLNVLDNAVKYRKDNEPLHITVDAGVRNSFLRIAISDNGIGIRKDQLKNIFDKFYRVSAGDVHNIKGMGLGLYFVKKSMDALGGKIFTESMPGKGTTFTLEFPLSS